MEARLWAELHGFNYFATSAASGAGVTDLFQVVVVLVFVTIFVLVFVTIAILTIIITRVDFRHFSHTSSDLLSQVLERKHQGRGRSRSCD